MSDISDKVEKVANQEGEESPLGKGILTFYSKYKFEIISLIATTTVAAMLGLTTWYINKQFCVIEKDIETSSKKITATENHITELKINLNNTDNDITNLKSQLKMVGNELLNLNSKAFFGDAVFYRDEDIVPADKNIKICALSLNFPFPCNRAVLREYQGKTIYISIGDHLNNSQPFEVRGFFCPRQENRMIQIPKSSLKYLVPLNEQEEYINKGVIRVRIAFVN